MGHSSGQYKGCDNKATYCDFGGRIKSAAHSLSPYCSTRVADILWCGVE